MSEDEAVRQEFAMELLKRIARQALWLQFQRSHLQASSNDAAFALVDLCASLDELPSAMRRELWEGAPKQ